MNSDLFFTEILLTAFMILVVLFIWSALIYFHYKARKMVFNWAEKNKYSVLKLKFRFIFKGPYSWWGHSAKRQKVFYAVLMDNNSKVHYAFINCGDYWRGLSVEKVEVKWETDA